jgi:hypothetical protein
MDHYVKIALDEAKRLTSESTSTSVDEMARFLRQRKERYHRRLSAALEAFNSLPLTSGCRLVVENTGSASLMPCIRLAEELTFGGRLANVTLSDKRSLVELFLEVTNDGDMSQVQCRAECLWVDPPTRLTSSDPDNLLLLLAKQLANVLKVE